MGDRQGEAVDRWGDRRGDTGWRQATSPRCGPGGGGVWQALPTASRRPQPNSHGQGILTTYPDGR
jgi:hypothetical protein